MPKDVSVLAVVGAGMRGTPGVAGRVFGTLGDDRINIIAIAQGSSELNISFVVHAGDERRAVQVLHDELVLGRTPVASEVAAVVTGHDSQRREVARAIRGAHVLDR